MSDGCRRPLLLLDVDGVLCNFVQGMIESHGRSTLHDEYSCFDFHRTAWQMSDREFWKPTYEEDWWFNLKPYPGSQEFVRLLRASFDVIFSTAPQPHRRAVSERFAWLRHHGFMQADECMIGRHKHLMAGSGAILLDDSDANVDEFVAHGGKAILYPQPWNANAGWCDRRADFLTAELGVLIAENTL